MRHEGVGRLQGEYLVGRMKAWERLRSLRPERLVEGRRIELRKGCARAAEASSFVRAINSGDERPVRIGRRQTPPGDQDRDKYAPENNGL